MQPVINYPIVPKKYSVCLKIDHEQPNFKGDLDVRLCINSTCREFSLNAHELIVLSASIDGNPLKVSYDRKLQKCIFSSAVDLLPKKTGNLNLKYIGKVNQINTFRDQTRGVFKTNFMNEETGKNDSWVISTHGQPFFARYIIPCIDECHFKAVFQLQIKCPSKFTVISNRGISSKTVDEKKDLQTVLFKETPKMNSSLFGFSIGDFKYIEATVISTFNQKEIPVRIYGTRDIAHATYSLDVVCKYLPVLENWFQFSFPVEKLDLVLLPFLSDMAMENFGMITVQMSHLLLPASATAAEKGAAAQLLVHELVHQWIGNYVNFDSWDHMWFNESFATWLANEILNDELRYWESAEWTAQLENIDREETENNIGSIVTLSHREGNIVHSSDTLHPHAYAKGICILRFLSEYIGPLSFRDGIRALFTSDNKFHDVAIKPIDIFYFLDGLIEGKKIANIFSCWTHTQGIPLLQVKNGKDGKLKIEQDRYAELMPESPPYHIPLFIKNRAGEKVCLITTRTIEIENNGLISLNAGRRGFYKVSYLAPEIYVSIRKAVSEGTLTSIELYGVFEDISDLIANVNFQDDIHLQGLTDILGGMVSSPTTIKRYLIALARGLECLQEIERSWLCYGRAIPCEYSEKIYTPLFKNITWPRDFSKEQVDEQQLQVMSQTLFGLRQKQEVIQLCKRYYNCIHQGPKESIPLLLISSILSVISSDMKTLKEWKRFYHIVQSAPMLSNHIISGRKENSTIVRELQNATISNLSFSRASELIHKTLNFVTTNIESPGIEKALLGMKYNATQNILLEGKEFHLKTIRDIVFEWFETNFNRWASKVIVEGAESSKKIHKVLINICTIVFQMWCDSPGNIDTFVTMKAQQFGQSLSFSETWKIVQEGESKKIKIYHGLL